MRSWPVLLCSLAVLVFGGGCFPAAQSQLDEQKEQHFLTGKARANAMDYKGAIEAFERALELNPRSASAHFELGLLYEKHELDYAAAIYHFERFLRLRPESEYAEIVKQRMMACKQELAKTVSLGPVTQTMQRDLERLTAENRELRQKLEAWQAYYASRAQGPTEPPPVAPAAAGDSSAQTPVAAAASQRTAAELAPLATTTAPRQAAPAPHRTHTVKQGETPYGIARKHGVKLEALLAANPSLNPKRLQVGQTLKLPAP